MTKNRKHKEYPLHIIERIVSNQMRLMPEDGALYENAIRNVYAAFDIAEQYTNRIIVRSRVTFGLAEMMQVVDIPTAPVSVIESVKYYDAEDRLQTLALTDYVLIASEHSTSIEFSRLPRLSSVRSQNRVLIDAVCGYSDYCGLESRASDDDGGIVLPGSIEAAIQLMAGTLCEADGDAIIGRSVNTLPLTADRLLTPYRMTPYGWQN